MPLAGVFCSRTSMSAADTANGITQAAINSNEINLHLIMVRDASIIGRSYL